MKTYLRKDEVIFKDLVYSLLLGEFDSVRRGEGGFDFDAVRPFQAGDSPRDLNRSATRRTGVPHVTTRNPERDLELIFIADLSGSTRFGSKKMRKVDYLWRFIAEALSLLADEHMRFSILLPQGAGFEHLLLGQSTVVADQEIKKIRVRAEGVAPPPFNLAEAFRKILSRGGERTFYVLVLSDFVAVSEYDKELRELRRAGHSVLGIALSDPMERALPAVSCLTAFSVQDMETGEEATIGSLWEYLSPHRLAFQAARCRFEELSTSARR